MTCQLRKIENAKKLFEDLANEKSLNKPLSVNETSNQHNPFQSGKYMKKWTNEAQKLPQDEKNTKRTSHGSKEIKIATSKTLKIQSDEEILYKELPINNMGALITQTHQRSSGNIKVNYIMTKS